MFINVKDFKSPQGQIHWFFLEIDSQNNKNIRHCLIMMFSYLIQRFASSTGNIFVRSHYFIISKNLFQRCNHHIRKGGGTLRQNERSFPYWFQPSLSDCLSESNKDAYFYGCLWLNFNTFLDFDLHLYSP